MGTSWPSSWSQPYRMVMTSEPRIRTAIGFPWTTEGQSLISICHCNFLRGMLLVPFRYCSLRFPFTLDYLGGLLLTLHQHLLHETSGCLLPSLRLLPPFLPCLRSVHLVLGSFVCFGKSFLQTPSYSYATQAPSQNHPAREGFLDHHPR